MVDRSKELYQQQLAAHAAWTANFGGASSGYSPAAGAGGHAGFPGSHPGAGANNPYENYMQRLQQFAGLGSQHNSSMFNNFSKDISSFSSPFGLPPGHPMHFSGLGNYNPLPAHSPLPAHLKNSNSTPPASPLPAHLRSSPYQQHSGYPYNYGVHGYPGVQQPGAGYADHAEQARRQALHNGAAGGFLPSNMSAAASAYSQLQQLSAANNKEASDKQSHKPGPSASLGNNNYPYTPSSSTAQSAGLTGQPGGGAGNNYDQIAAALLNRFSGQFNSQLMSEMVKSSPVSSSSSSLYSPLSVPSYTAGVSRPGDNNIPRPRDQEEKPLNIRDTDPTPHNNPPPPVNGPSSSLASSSRVSPRVDDDRTQQSAAKPSNISSVSSEKERSELETSRSSVNTSAVNHVSSSEVTRSESVSRTVTSSATMSITNKIKDLQSRQASSTSKQSSSSTLSKDDRSELKGLWKMQARLYQQKPGAVSKAKSSSPSTSADTSVSKSETVTTTSSVTTPVTSSTAALPVSSSQPVCSPGVQNKTLPSSLTSEPPLLHTPRSPPHPPPPLHQSSYSHHQQSHYNSSHPPYYSQPPHYQPSPYQPPASVPSSSTPSTLDSARKAASDANHERMEVKNSGIPGPSAISWKRKSVEDSPSSGNIPKKRKVVSSSEDPYSFEDEDKSKAHIKTEEGVTNGNLNSSGYKYKSALMTREHDVESDESSVSDRATSPSKKNKKRPKIEEWSVNKDKKSSKSTPKKGKIKEEPVETTPSNKVQEDKKGSTWGFKSSESSSDAETKEKVKAKKTKTIEKAKDSSVANVWLQAFGAGPNKAKKNESSEKVKEEKTEKTEKEPVIAKSTILDIPPEIRRKSRPKFGGLIHFDPEWSRAVRRHHERCRLPPTLDNSSQLKPKILEGHQTPKKSYEDQARKAMVSPPNMLAIEKERLEKNAVAHKLPVSVLPEEELSGELPSIVETILENRKKLREASEGRMYKIPFMKEKKKRMMRAPVQCEIKSGPLGLLPTPGLPLLTEDTKDVLLGTGFGNFRHYTLSKFMSSEAKVTDLQENKPRRQASSMKPVINLREIFGAETPVKKSKKSSCSSEKKNVEKKDVSQPKVTQETPVKKGKKKKERSESKPESTSLSSKGRKFSAKLRDIVCDDDPDEECGYSHETGDATESEKNLQFDLGAFALDLLEDNPSWSKQVAIQNLVIWEPTEPVLQETSKKKRPGKKKRTRKSGLDFQTNKRKSRGAAVAQSDSPEAEDVHEVVYNLDNVVGESSRWVIDKNAGETILHRASKMGYPDVAAYALDMANMDPMERDYAGLTPLHKASLKGHANVAKILLQFGADPSAGMKGTRALHEGKYNLLNQEILNITFL